ncbi:hypothetical protein [Paraburkholderia sp. BL21I4N1]|uniref:hypothetical protein n=1 Tax=Paraburkholderia sp. BL21I4N1 TaxID=1938801 RepID=UPI000CFC601B|nr:hypothetical protein [Paraburkholderia sp. BL21I4N1]PQV48596.1 hypothetical protein B0G83_108123 [Paraburkholderia sp. BL21I4N1]
MAKKFVARYFYTASGKFEGETTEGWFWNKKKKKVQVPTERLADYDNFCQSVESIYNDLDSEGYDVVNIIPLAIGASEPNHAKLKDGSSTYLGDAGFSVTRGAVIVGKLRTS